MPSLYLLSLPPKAAPGTLGEPETRLKSWIEQNIGAHHGVSSIALPDLKIGMLDNLVQQAEDVAKLDSQLQNLLLKTHDSILSIFGSNQAQVKHAEQVDGRTAEAYLQQFGWNTAKYRPDKAISTLLSSLSQEANSADQDLKAKVSTYNSTKQQVQAIDRKFSGDLSVRSLDAVVRPSDLVQNSEFLVTLLVVVPLSTEKDFLAKYETVAPMVVPRSAQKLSADSTYVLYSVTVFKKYAKQFETKAREEKWLPRDPPQHHSETSSTNNDATESPVELAGREEKEIRDKERRQRSELERLAAISFSDIVKVWGHVKIIRVFVESVLRYGLPLNYLTATFETKMSTEKTEAKLLEEFSHLGGNAVARDSKGKAKIADDADLAEFAALVEQDYKPFVMYSAVLP